MIPRLPYGCFLNRFHTLIGNDDPLDVSVGSRTQRCTDTGPHRFGLGAFTLLLKNEQGLSVPWLIEGDPKDYGDCAHGRLAAHPRHADDYSPSRFASCLATLLHKDSTSISAGDALCT
jgi:hypothetical protein